MLKCQFIILTKALGDTYHVPGLVLETGSAKWNSILCPHLVVPREQRRTIDEY